MAIEGPLRELGIHDVFQLLDLSRKTGVLRVSSQLREDEGLVFFDSGRVVQASIRSKPPSTDSGAFTQKELDRLVRLQIESAVFELMSWREGFFSFEERTRDEMPGNARVTVSTESLLMEGARRIDEWSRIADLVPNLAVVPALAPVQNDRDGAMLDLLPHEWQVLTMIDGGRDLREIAAALARNEFEIAKIAYGLATTGIVILQTPRRTPAEPERTIGAATTSLPTSLPAVRSLSADLAVARLAVEQFLRAYPGDPAAPDARDALDAISRLQRVLEIHANG
jgi:hypothetical protein